MAYDPKTHAQEVLAHLALVKSIPEEMRADYLAAALNRAYYAGRSAVAEERWAEHLASLPAPVSPLPAPVRPTWENGGLARGVE
jgi:hypothetical protein